MNKEEEEEEEEEQLIDPKDLWLINDPKNWEPTQEQIIAYAEQLGFDIDNDPEDLLKIAYSYLKIEIPSDWIRAFTKVDNQLLYVDLNTNEIHLSTDIEENAQKNIMQFKEKYIKIKETEELKLKPKKNNEIKNKNNINKYEKIIKIHSGIYGDIYKGRNKETGNYVCIKEILKIKFPIEKEFLSQIKKMKLLNTENNISIIETIDTKYYFYIIMEFCILNLEEYMKLRKEGLSIEEVKDILIQLNKILKKINENKIIYQNLRLSNIFISLNKINKISIKLSGLNDYNNDYDSSKTKTQICLSEPPEIMKEGKINNKSDLWSLGIIIYYLLFKEYPYEGKRDYQLIKNIESNKQLKETNNKYLNDLLNRMICNDLNERISWEEYYDHLFFKVEDNIKNPEFNFNCKIHSKNISDYCVTCKNNICEDCHNNHLNHNIISISEIGMSEEEINKTQNLINDLETNISKINKIKEEMILFFNQIKNIKDNTLIYKNDENNNFKNFYIKSLETIKDKLKEVENFNIINLRGLKEYEENEIIEIVL